MNQNHSRAETEVWFDEGNVPAEEGVRIPGQREALYVVNGEELQRHKEASMYFCVVLTWSVFKEINGQLLRCPRLAAAGWTIQG